MAHSDGLSRDVATGIRARRGSSPGLSVLMVNGKVQISRRRRRGMYI